MAAPRLSPAASEPREPARDGAERLPATARARVAATRTVSKRPYLLLLPILPLLLATPLVGPSINPNLWGDEQGYVGLARRLIHGQYLTGRDDLVVGWPHVPNLWFGPGLPILLTPLTALSAPTDAIRLVGPLFVFGAALLLYVLLRRYVGPSAAVVGAAALALYPPVYTALVHLHSETLAVLLVVAMMLGTGAYLQTGQKRQLALAAAALGWLALTRVAFGWIVTTLLVLALLWWLLRRDSVAPRRFAAICTLALALCVPWLAYTYSVTNRPFYWGSSGGLSLYWMSSPYPADLGDWQLPSDVFVDSRLAPHRPFFRSLIGESIPEQNDRLERAALDNVRDHPRKYAQNVLANVSRMWFHFPYSFRQERLKPLIFVIPNAFVLSVLLLTLGLVAARRRLLPVEAVPFAMFGLVTFGFHALLSAYPRMLFPVIPVILWFATVAISRSFRLAAKPG
jgi:4-amino-4-deoxy-L-arabinose transferase-like glycosyltransferase